MIKICIPFLLTDSKQIPGKKFAGIKVSSEANIFDADELKKLLDLGHFDSLIKKATKISDISAFHFPTENADYFKSVDLFNTLIETIRIVGKNNIPNFVLHSNLIQSIQQFNYSNITEIRSKFIEKYEILNRVAKDSNTVICIENLPIIGNNGDDFDSVFVFPKDYVSLNFDNIKVAWDLGHWAYTCENYDRVAAYLNMRSENVPNFYDFTQIQDRIVRFHFSSFIKKDNGIGMPKCEEGIIPQLGNFDQNKLISICRKINSLNKSFDMTLEIREDDYSIRKNSALTVDWFNSNIFI